MVSAEFLADWEASLERFSKMQRNKIFRYGAFTFFAVALYFLLRKSGLLVLNSAPLPASSNTALSPDYLTYNTNKYGLPNLATVTTDQPVVSQTEPGATQPSCGCAISGQLDSSFLANVNDLSLFFVSTVKDVVAKYSANVESALPNFFTQYFNNPEGAALSQSSRQQLRSVF